MDNSIMEDGIKLPYDDIKSLTKEELIKLIGALGEKKFRAEQVYDWIHKKLVTDYDDMKNVPKLLKEKLANISPITTVTQVDKQVSAIDGTAKYLFKLSDGNLIESVLMRYRFGNSVCISSQAGCRMGCRFCASTLNGLSRSLLPSEMLDQIYRIQSDTGERVSHVVIMGTGEPFDNYDNVRRFVTLLTDENGINIGARNLTISTCGIVPRIRQFADEQLQVNLAISLHAPNDELRKTLMPVANKYSIEELIDACRYYVNKTSRRITYEYSLVKGVNDGMEQAMELISLIKGMNCHVNLIPVNPIKERDFKQTEGAQVSNFKNLLEKNGIACTIRREMGRDIDGACGQLRKSHLDEDNAM